MRRYETFVIFDPDIAEEGRVEFFDKIQNLISEKEGFIAYFDEWGVRKLAYEIKKKVRGHYTRLDYLSTSDVVQEIERLFRIDDRVMKYMTIILDKDADLEKVKQEISGEKEKQEAEADQGSEETKASLETNEESANTSDDDKKNAETATEDVKDQEPAKEEDK